jgi:TPR repeat protein
MGFTPARHEREAAKVDKEKDVGRLQNEAKFTEFDMACSGGQVSACNSLGEWYALMRSDFARSAELYASACVEGGHAQACLNLGKLLVAGREGVPADAPRALDSFRRGCVAGNGDACSHAGRELLRLSALPGKGADGGLVVAAEGMLRRGCTGGEGTAHAACCGTLAAVHLSTRAAGAATLPPADGEALLSWLHSACTRGEHVPSCARLASLHRRGGALSPAGSSAGGLRLPPDSAKADSYEKQGLMWQGLTEARAEREMAKRRR